jgi:hypothetical protein
VILDFFPHHIAAGRIHPLRGAARRGEAIESWCWSEKCLPLTFRAGFRGIYGGAQSGNKWLITAGLDCGRTVALTDPLVRNLPAAIMVTAISRTQFGSSGTEASFYPQKCRWPRAFHYQGAHMVPIAILIVISVLLLLKPKTVVLEM